MSNLDKIVKLACKPKNAPPKAKYVDLNDITRSLSLRLREANAVMIRSGSTDNLLQHLSQNDSLRLRNITAQNWEGYSPPSSMPAYARYLDARIKAWREIKHDLVRVQAESNRRSDGLGAGSKARRLRHLPVEKGLLREVKQVQDVLFILVSCRFYDDDMRDENTVLAFRMLIKDLLVLFQAGNEGVCNILEHYFEMSKPDATEAFEIYKSFISLTDKVVDYLGVVRKLHNIVNVPVPNLKHAPTGLVKALEEYLQDPNFEDNRREYKASLGVVEGRPNDPSPAPDSRELNKPAAKTENDNASSSLISAPAVSTPVATAPPGSSKKIQDFFDSIQTSQQPTMFGGPAQQFTPQMQMQMQPAFNPFRQSMMLPQQTGMPFQQPFMQPQQTGFSPQQTNFGQAAPFLQPQATGQMAFGTGSINNRQSMFPQQTGTGQFGQFGQMSAGGQPGQFGQMSQNGHTGQNGMMQSQQTGFNPQQNGFAQPQPLSAQATGSNPFRQSMMLNTSLNSSGALSQPASPFQPMSTNGPSQSFGQSQVNRPGSTPALSVNTHFSSINSNGPKTGDVKPLTAQPTGSNNPFAPPGGIQPKVEVKPKGPSMNELAWNRQQSMSTQQTGFQSPFGMNSQPTGFGGNQGVAVQSPSSPWGNIESLSNNNKSNANDTTSGGNGISDIASSFTFGNGQDKPQSATATGSSSSDFLSQFGSLSMGNQNTGSNSPFGSISSTPTGQKSLSGGFLQPQQTGYGGSTVKRFQPTSSFGSTLMETLPPIPEPGAASPPVTSLPSGVPNSNNSFPFGQTGAPNQGGGLTQSMTGLPNPFRQNSLGGQQQGNQGVQGGQGAFGGSMGSAGPFGGQNRQPFGSNNLM